MEICIVFVVRGIINLAAHIYGDCSYYERPNMAKRYYEEKRQESRDGGMLNENRGAVANMPQDIKYHDWPRGEMYLGEAVPELNDKISGINSQMSEDVNGAKRHRSHNKY